MEENRKSRATPSDVQRHRLDDTLMVGRLTAHGPAPYQFRRGGDPSYFVKVLTQRGERVVWGKDLRRAVQESMTAVVVGDLIAVQRTGRDPVTLASHRSAAVGRDSQQSQPPAYRNRWVVEKAAFFAERARLARQLRDEQLDVSAAVRERPELKSTFLTLRAAREFAKKRVKDPRDQ